MNGYKRRAAKNVQFMRGASDMKFFLCVIGMVMIVEGLPYFASPEWVKSWMERIQTLPDSLLRRLGFGLMLGGLVLVYFGKLGAS
jgi:uncharacterized protein YjeT (DUF2065 family)